MRTLHYKIKEDGNRVFREWTTIADGYVSDEIDLEQARKRGIELAVQGVPYRVKERTVELMESQTVDEMLALEVAVSEIPFWVTQASIEWVQRAELIEGPDWAEEM